MDSSDSEDDCYGNIAQKLQSMKNKYTEDKIDSANFLNDSAEAELDEIIKKAKTTTKIDAKPSSEKQEPVDSSEHKIDDVLIDTIIESSSKRLTRSAAKRSSLVVSKETSPAPKKSKRKKTNAETANESIVNISTESISNSGTQTSRGKRKSRGRGRNNNRSRNVGGCSTNINIPTYSVGNTDEYPDQSDSQALFSTNTNTNDVFIVEDNELDENEELSVKVYWQSSEFFKFNIRRFQKLTQIFEYFSKKENVSNDKLFFTFNDKILKPDDTPDLIDYNIAKFIDGGIVNQSVSKLVTTKVEKDRKVGITLKFQCQNVKKPFETVVGLDEKLSIAMMKCAEHLETTVTKLRFEFDGDSILGKNTARELDLEGGECIDVRIAS